MMASQYVMTEVISSAPNVNVLRSALSKTALFIYALAKSAFAAALEACQGGTLSGRLGIIAFSSEITKLIASGLLITVGMSASGAPVVRMGTCPHPSQIQNT